MLDHVDESQLSENGEKGEEVDEEMLYENQSGEEDEEEDDVVVKVCVLLQLPVVFLYVL